MMNALLPVRVQGVPQGEERVTVLVHHRKEVVLQSVRDRQLSHDAKTQMGASILARGEID